MKKLHSIDNRWIGLILGGIIGVFLISILSDKFSIHFVTINIITLIFLFCITYYKASELVKNSKVLNRIHLIFIHLLIGAVFGLFVGLMSYEGEIYWFVFGFVIISLIPKINMLIVVFWLGATIYTLYQPDILIPFISNFLPIQLIDISMRKIAGLPLFIFPAIIFLGYLIGKSYTKFQEKKKLMLSKNAKQEELKNKMKKYASKLKKWKIEGYDTDNLIENLKGLDLTNKIQNLKNYESKIEKLKQFEKDIQQFDIKEFNKEFSYDINSIKEKFKDPYKTDEIKSDLLTLKKRIKLKIQELAEKTENEINNGIIDAINTKNSGQLSTLKTLQEEVLKFNKSLESTEITYKDAVNKIEELYTQAVTIDVPPNNKQETPPPTKIEKLNFYEIFNIEPDATQDQIKKIFKRLTLEYHPDRKEVTGVEDEQRFRMIIEAYETLKDPYKRKKYDEEHRILK